VIPKDGELAMLEKRAREIVEIRLTLLTTVLLSAFPRRSFLDDWFVLSAIDARLRRARSGATESLVALVRIRKEHFY
jgi:hypothetical protein